MLMVGYFEGIDSERGIAWRCEDSPGDRRHDPGGECSDAGHHKEGGRERAGRPS